MAIAKIVKWALIGVVIVVVGLAALILAVLAFLPASLAGPTAAPLQLPALNSVAASANPALPTGTWRVGDGSVAGFRVDESFLTQSSTLVGRTRAVTGALVIANSVIVSGAFQVDLSQLTLGGKPNANFFNILDTNNHPSATLTLTSPIAFDTIPTAGQTMAASAAGALTLRGVTHPVSLAFTGRFEGSVLEATGSAPVLASEWGIASPFGLHDNDVIEFLVILRPG